MRRIDDDPEVGGAAVRTALLLRDGAVPTVPSVQLEADGVRIGVGTDAGAGDGFERL